MYNLIKLTADFDDSFVFFIISKNVHKTFSYLATQINSKNVNNPLFKFLATKRKKLYDLNRDVVFSSVKLDEVETEKRKLENQKVQPIEVLINKETPIQEQKPEGNVVEEVIEPVVEKVKHKTKRTYNKKIKSEEITAIVDETPIDNTPNIVGDSLLESSEEVLK